MGKISDQASLGTREATAEVELIFGGVNYRQAVSILFDGFLPADDDPTLAADSDLVVPTQAAIKAYVDAAVTGGVADADYGDIVVSSSGTVWVLDSNINFATKQLNSGTWDNPVIQNGVINDCAIDTISSVDVQDSSFAIHDQADATKTAQFECATIATATTRTFTFPNASGTIALTSDLSSGYQPLDSDLTAIAAIAPSNDDIIQRKAGAWTNRTMAQLATDLSGSFQPLDSDLTTLAGLTATTDNFLQSKSSAWASRTVAQVSVDLQATGLVTDAVGFRTIPQNSQSAAYTTVAADSGKHILHPSGDANARTFTIDSNANVPYPVGTAITFVNQTSQVVTIAIATDTMTLAGTTTTGSRSLAQNGIATALKITSTAWVISGSGLT